jgi:hypothetical protein
MAMEARVTLDAGPDDAGPHHDHNCDCRTCRRRAALKGEGIVPLVNSLEDGHGEPDVPPRHRETGRFMAPLHPRHDDRNIKGQFVEDGAYD